MEGYTFPKRGKVSYTNPNVRIKSSTKRPEDSKENKGRKFSLENMLQNAKKVKVDRVDPLLERLDKDGYIPSPFLDGIEEALTHKFSSFHRKLDENFTTKFGELYHNKRQEAFQKAQTLVTKNRSGFDSLVDLKGMSFMTPEEYIVYTDKPLENVYVAPSVEIKLPRACYSTYSYNMLESAMIYSNKMDGNVSLNEEFLRYKTTFSAEGKLMYVDELDELKYIYKNFWRLVRTNRKNWLPCLYQEDRKKAHAITLPSWTPSDGMTRDESTVLLAVEGVNLFTDVDTLYEWIVFYRQDSKKSYAIGECDNDLAVLFAIYLMDMGYSKEIIRERLSLELLSEVGNYLELEILGMTKTSDPEDDLEELLQFGFDLSSLGKATQGGTSNTQEETLEIITELAEPVSWANINFDSMNLEDEDSNPSISICDVESIHSDEENLPYDRNLHASNNEFEVWAGLVEREVDDDNDSVSSNDSVNTENMPDNKLNAIEELGIDLIDPSRDDTLQPSIRRIGLVWDPGGAPRPPPKRFNRLFGESKRDRV